MFMYVKFLKNNAILYFSLRREYPPLSLHKLQMLIDSNRLDITKPIDLITLLNTKLYYINVNHKHAGVHLTDEVTFF